MFDSEKKPARPVPAYGLPTLTMLVIASMVGVGVFTTSGFTLAAVGTPARVMLCWAIAGAIAMSGAVAYAQLARRMPESGGEYLYLSRNVHPVVGFLAGWVSLTAGFSGAIATAAVGFERYAMPDTIRPAWLPTDSVAILLVVLCAVAHGRHAVTGKQLQNGVVIVKLVTLFVFGAMVLLKLPTHSWHWQPSTVPEDDMWQSAVAIATSLVWISLSYAGFNAAIYVASESSEARRNVPRALLLGTGLVTLLYLMLNAVFVTSVPVSELAGQEAVAAIAAAAIGGDWLEMLMRVAVSLGLLSSVMGMIMTGPRVYSRMADDGVFPLMFAASRQGVPRSIFLQAGIAVGLILLQRILVATGLLSSSLLGLLMYLSTTLSVTSAVCVATLFLPQVRREAKPSKRADAAAAIYVLTTTLSIALLVQSHKVNGQSQGLWHLTGAVITFATGLIAWTVFQRRRA
ncbi:MAG: APC family permease [Planctomycetaceae bacterium]